MTRHSQIIINHKTISSIDDIPGLTVHEKLFKGGCGTIFRGVDHTTKQEVAIKYSKFDLSNENSKSILFGRIRKIYIFEHGIFKYRSTQLKGQNETTLLKMYLLCCHKSTRNIKGSPYYEYCIINLLQLIYYHSKNIIHRDIKPTNLMIKSLEDSQIYLIDFGIAKEADQFIYSQEVEGTQLYDPLQVHKRLPYRFIDDIEMLAYTLVFLFKGHLPWIKYPNTILYNDEVMRHKEQYLSSKIMSKLPFAELFGYESKCI